MSEPRIHGRTSTSILSARSKFRGAIDEEDVTAAVQLSAALGEMQRREKQERQLCRYVRPLGGIVILLDERLPRVEGPDPIFAVWCGNPYLL
jgi:hypothetical protein